MSTLDGAALFKAHCGFVAGFLCRLGGNELQRIVIASDGNPDWGAAHALRTLSNGDILIAGILKRPVDFGGGMLGAAEDTLSSGFLARFTQSGQFVTSQIFGQNSGVTAIGLAVGADGSIVLSGNLNGVKSIFGCSSTAQMAPGFVAKLDDALSVQWATLIPAGVGHPEIDPQGNIVLATKTPANVYLVRLDPTGNSGSAWWTVAGAAAGYRAVLAPSGTIYVSGSFRQSVSFDQTLLTTADSDAAGFIVGVAP